MNQNFSLSYYTRLGLNKNDTNKKKIKIYLSYFKDDEESLKKVVDYILKYNDAIIFFLDYKEYPKVDFKELSSLISQTQVAVFAISEKYLKNPNNESLTLEFPYIRDNNIPFLPIIDSGELLDEYSSKFGKIQFLNINQKDKTQIDASKKLSDFLKGFIADDEDYQLAREAFSNQLFLSYRKKDRLHALKLIEILHESEDLRDIAIWYDEFLTIGNEFDKDIQYKLDQSKGLIILVTPNLYIEDNYVRSEEYPLALKQKKPIFPYKAVDVSETSLYESFKKLPPLEDKTSIIAKIKESFKDKKQKFNAQKYHALGIAYLYGIQVEINRKIAIEFLEKAAARNYIPSLELLESIYETGNGVVKDIVKAKEYQTLLSKIYEQKKCTDSFDENDIRYFEMKLKSLTSGAKVDTTVEQLNEEYAKMFRELLEYQTFAEGTMNTYDQLIITCELAMLSEDPSSQVFVDDIIRRLDSLKANDYDVYIIHYIVFMNSYILPKVQQLGELENAIEEYNICFRKYLKDDALSSKEEIVFNSINAIFNSQLLGFNLKLKELELIREELEKYLYSEHLQNVNLLCKASILELKANYGLCVDIDEAYKEAEALLLKYKKSFENSPILFAKFNNWHALPLSSENLKSARAHALKEAGSLDDYVFENENILLAKVNLECREIFIDPSLSLDDKEKKLETKLFEYGLDNKNKFSQLIIQNYLLDFEIDKKDLKKSLLYFDYLDKYFKDDKNYISRRIFFQFFICALKKDYSNITKCFDELTKSPTLYKVNIIEDFLLFVTNAVYEIFKHIDETNEFEIAGAVKVHRLILNFVFNSQINAEKVDINKYPRLIKLLFEIRVKTCALYKDPKFNIDQFMVSENIYHSFMEKVTDFSSPSVINLTKTFISSEMFYLVYANNSEVGFPEESLKRFTVLMKTYLPKMGYDKFSELDMNQVAVIAYLMFAKNIDNTFIVEVFNNSFTDDQISNFGGNLYSLFLSKVNKEGVGELQKAQFLVELVSNFHSLITNEDEKEEKFFSITYFISICLLNLKQYSLLLKFHELIFEKSKGNDNQILFNDFVHCFIAFDRALLGENVRVADCDSIRDRSKQITFVNMAAFGKYFNGLNIKYFEHLTGKEIDGYPLFLDLNSFNSAVSIFEAYPNENYDDYFRRVFTNLAMLKKRDEKKGKHNRFWTVIYNSIDKLDKVFTSKPIWYMQNRVRFTAAVVADLIEERNYHGVLNEYSKLINLISEAKIGIDVNLSEQFMFVLRCTIQSLHALNFDKNTILNVCQNGAQYFYKHKAEYPEEQNKNLLYAIGEASGNGFYKLLAAPFANELKKDTTIMLETYDKIVNAFIQNNLLDHAIYFLLRKVKYLDEYCQDHPDKIQLYISTYKALRNVYEKIGDDDSAYHYQELYRHLMH